MKISNELPNRVKYLTAAAIYCGNLASGASITSYGAVLTTLQHKFDVDDAAISKIFTILTICCLLGSLLGGALIFDRVNRQLAVIVIMAVEAFGMYITPNCSTLKGFFGSVAMVGTVAGAYDTAQFVWMVEMMQKDCPPFVQGQHFFYALGTIVGTLLMAQFLTDDVTITAQEKAAKLTVPYTIIAGLLTLTAIFHGFLFAYFRYYKPPPEANRPDKPQDKSPSHGPTCFGTRLWPWSKLRLVILSCVFYSTYCGMEMTTFSFLPKFGQNSDLKLSEQSSAYVLTGMTVAFAAGRGIAVILVFKLSTKIILCINIIITIIANTILLNFASTSLVSFWMASVLFGLGFSSTYASFAAFIERHLNITNTMGSILLVCSYGLPAIYPLIVGSYIESNPTVLSYVIFFSISMITMSVGSLIYLTASKTPKYSALKNIDDLKAY